MLNSYALETLEGIALLGVYNARCLQSFEPHKSTQLALNELARLEDEHDSGVLDPNLP